MMADKRRRNSVSVYDCGRKKKDPEIFLDKKINLPGTNLTIGMLIGVFTTVITIVLQFIAIFTPHWKEVSPNARSLYVDGVDALIRTEVLIYFDVVHRFTHHSYGLFQRCDYPLANTSKFLNEPNTIQNSKLRITQKLCTKNFLPSYDDKQFNECHSLHYYQFCLYKNVKNFDIHNDYLRETLDVSSDSPSPTPSTSSCDCHYPLYIKTCQVLGILSLICLCVMFLLFIIFPCLRTRHDRLKVKCFAVLSSLLAMLFIISNLLTILHYFEYESTEYLTAIERHYRSSQIYKLSQDTKVAIERFLSSVKITTGYSAILAWISFFLSIVDSLLLMIGCKVIRYDNDVESLFSGVPIDSPRPSLRNDSDVYATAKSPLTSPMNMVESEPLRVTDSMPPLPPTPRSLLKTSPMPPSTSAILPQTAAKLPPIIVISDTASESNEYSCSSPICAKHYSTSPGCREDEV